MRKIELSPSVLPESLCLSDPENIVGQIQERAGMGVIGILNQFNPELRGHAILSFAYPPEPELLKQAQPQLLLGLVRALGNRARYLARWGTAFLPFAAEFLGKPRYGQLAQDELVSFSFAQDQASELVIPAFDRLLDEPDVDFKLSKGTTPEKVLGAWEQQQLPLNFFELINPSQGIYYGWSIAVLPTKTPGLERVSIFWGYFELNQGSYSSLCLDSQVDFIPQTDGVDLRGNEGLSTDCIRGKHLGDGVFCLRGETVPLAIKFPSEETISQPHCFLQLAPRAVMQSLWHGLKIEPLKTACELSPALAQREFSKEPRLRDSLITKLVDGFLFAPQKAFETCERLGLWKTSVVMATKSLAQRREIQNALKFQDEHRTLLERNKRLPVEKRYSAFADLINALNRVGRLNLPVWKDWLIFYDLF